MSFAKILSILFSVLVISPCILSFLSLIGLVQMQWFNKFFCYSGELHQKFFLDMSSLYIIFIASTHFGMAITGENKKSSIMLTVSMIPIVIMMLSLKMSMQYREVLNFFVIIGIMIIEKLYDISGVMPKYLLKTRLLIGVVVCTGLLYFILF